MGNVVNQLAFPAPDPRYSQPLLEAREDTIWLRTQKAKIVAVDLRNAKRSEQAYNGVEYVILYSHGNAEDVGLALPYLEELARITDCSVFAYEYEGYSLSEGEPTEHGCYRSINAAYRHLIEKRGFSGDRIFIFGRSIGSGPSTDLASRCGKHGCGGLLLQSPLESGARAVFGNFVAAVGSGLDIFKNIDKVDRVEVMVGPDGKGASVGSSPGATLYHHNGASLKPGGRFGAPGGSERLDELATQGESATHEVPVCIMHGEADEVVPCANGRNLFNKLNQTGFAATPLWVPGRGHNDMPERDCLIHAKRFIVERVAAMQKAQDTRRII
eukprot:g1919.t1